MIATQVLTPTLRDLKKYLISIGCALILLFVMTLDQGHMFSLIQGQVAFAQNVVHEVVHDSRHVTGVPCH